MLLSPHGWVKAPASIVFSLPGELLATYLRVRYFDRGRGCWASLETIGAGLVSVRQTRRHLRELERRGLIHVTVRGGGRTLAIQCADGPAPDGGVQEGWTGASISAGRGRPEKQRFENKIKGNNDADAVVVDSAPKVAPSAEVAAVVLPEDLDALPHKRRGLSRATLVRLVDRHGVEAVRGAVAVLTGQYPTDATVKRAFGALLAAALDQRWTSQAQDDRAERVARMSTIEAARPPADTGWARAAGGVKLRVLEVRADVVRTETGVIPAHHWPNWTWESGDKHADVGCAN